MSSDDHACYFSYYINIIMTQVTIITPAYNAEKYIDACVRSVAEQKYPNIEHIVIDDGSADRTLLKLEAYSHLRLVRQSRCGATVARNRGLELAQGDYIKFLDADDVLAPDAIVNQVEGLAQLAVREISYGYQEVFNDEGVKKVCKRDCEQIYEPYLVDMIFRNIVTSLSLYPVGALKEVQGFDARMTSRQEWNLNIKLAVAGYRFKYQDIFTYRQRYHDSPDRISNRKLVAETEIQNMDYAHDAIKDVDDPLITDAWATYIWEIGRQCVFAGDDSGARKIFRYAKQVSPSGYNRYSSNRYRKLTSVCGPILADKIYAALILPFRKRL